MYNYFFVEAQLKEMETGEDVAIVLKKANFLNENLDRVTLKQTLQIVGRNDLATKLEIYLGAG